jgi:site-specific DNA recombinase
VSAALPLRIDDPLVAWIDRRSARSAGPVPDSAAVAGGLRFAFYGRVSTKEFQDRTSSCYWQREVANDLVAGRGTIVAEFFDIGLSRRRGWERRPQAAALLAALADPARGFDAVVVGEYERAFYGNQFGHITTLLDRAGIQLWLPETDGPVDPHCPTHQALIMLLGAQSKREVLRARFRVTAAMQAQTREQGRYLGGRPPYGYRLTDAGPHPNTAHAQWGRRLRRLEPDPATAPHVQWMFAQRLTGRSIANIARTLNQMGVPCPSSTDPARNPHRTGKGWTLRTVACILANPRYTGRQVWNRHSNNRKHADQTENPAGQTPIPQQRPASHPVVSTKAAHIPLVSEGEFIAAQHIHAARPTSDQTTRTYLLAGLLRCGLCNRRMDSHWVNGRPGYRCRHGRTTANPPNAGHPRNLYLREDTILTSLAATLTTETQNPRHLADHLRSEQITIVCSYHQPISATLRPDNRQPRIEVATEATQAPT